MPYRVLTLALAVVLLVTFASPAKAEAMEPTVILAIAGAALLIVVLIVYLVVANVEGPKMSASLPVEGPVLAPDPAAFTPEPQVVVVAVDVPRQGP